jgi:hypothetical protein
MTEELLTRCRIIDSSGCHRYEYWNEQSLFDGRPDTGWCSPSRSRPSIEHLLVETNDSRPINALRMLSRSINENAGFPEVVELLIPVHDGVTSHEDWRTIHIASGLKPAASSWVRIDLPPVATRQLLLRLAGAGIRPDGKQFTQLMCLQVIVEA